MSSTYESTAAEPAVTVGQQVPARYHMVILATIVAAIGGILFGYDIGIISGALLQLRDEFELSCILQEVLVSSVVGGAFVASLFGGLAVDFVGRKISLLITCGLFVTGAVLMAAARSISLLIIGRFILGVAIGLSVIAECTYISEISMPSHRGKLVSLNEFAISIGFLLAYLVNFLCVSIPHGWRIMFGISAGLAVIQGLTLLCMPLSPRFLISRGRKLEALKVLLRLRGSERMAQEEFRSLEEAITLEKSLSCKELFNRKSSMFYRLAIGCTLVFLQQVSGQPTILYYMPVILESVGFQSDKSALLATVGVGFTKACAVLAAILLVDRVGRRKLLISGTIIMSLCAFVMAEVADHIKKYNGRECQPDFSSLHHDNAGNSTVFDLSNDAVSPAIRWSALIALLMYVAGYSIGFGPASVRGRCVGFATSLNWLANILVSLTFLDYMGAVGVPVTFLTYAATCSTAVIFSILLVPETRCKTLEQLSQDIISETLCGTCCAEPTPGQSGSYVPLNAETHL